MRYLCLDVGDRWIGVARSDDSAILASPVTTIRRTALADDLRKLATLAEESAADMIVVGLPKNMNGTLGPQAERTIAFARRLHRLGRKIVLWNEQLSSVVAEEAVREGRMRAPRRGERLDAYAAAVILQEFLDSGAPPAGTPIDETLPNTQTLPNACTLPNTQPEPAATDDVHPSQNALTDQLRHQEILN